MSPSYEHILCLLQGDQHTKVHREIMCSKQGNGILLCERCKCRDDEESPPFLSKPFFYVNKRHWTNCHCDDLYAHSVHVTRKEHSYYMCVCVCVLKEHVMMSNFL